MSKRSCIFLVVLTAVLLCSYGESGAVSEPNPPRGFKVTDYLTGLNDCITLAFAPDGRLFFLEKNTGRVRVAKDGRLDPVPWVKLTVDPVGERGLLGIAFDPDFKKNGFVYLYYSVAGSTNNRVVRLQEVNGRGRGLVKVVEIKDHVRASNHNGGNINFGPDGYLYITVGDGGGSPGRSQEDSNLLGKILRVNVRGPLPVKYKRPSDIFYAKGLRNSFDMAWNPANNILYATENGPIGRDEINRIVKGGNYGWPEEMGFDSNHVYENPLWDFGKTSVAPTGIVFYPQWGNFPDEYKHNMFVVDYNYGRLYRIRLSGERLDNIGKEDFLVWMPVDFAGTVFADITVGPDGALYLAGFSKVVKIEYGR
jgi:glucose/arabinose dehydrogenase